MQVEPDLAIDELGGSGEPIIFVHGLGGSSNTWYPQAEVLKHDHRAIAYDLAGSGRSPVPNSISIESHVRQLASIIESIGSASVHLAGHSMGSVICQHLATTRPELVLSLSLFGAFLAPPDPARVALRDRAAKARSDGMRAVADAVLATGISRDTRINNPSAAAYVRESITAQPAAGYALNCLALADAAPAPLSAIRCPVLLVTGDEDRTGPPETAKAMQSQLSQAELVIVPGCGHWPTIERARQSNYALAKFLATLRQASQTTKRSG